MHTHDAAPLSYIHSFEKALGEHPALFSVLRIQIRMNLHQIERKYPDPHVSDKLDPEPDLHQSDKLDPDAHQFADVKPKCTYEI